MVGLYVVYNDTLIPRLPDEGGRRNQLNHVEWAPKIEHACASHKVWVSTLLRLRQYFVRYMKVGYCMCCTLIPSLLEASYCWTDHCWDTHVLCRLIRYRHLTDTGISQIQASHRYRHLTDISIIRSSRFWNPTNAIQPLGHLGCRAASTWSRMTEKLVPALWLQSCSTFMKHLWGTSTCAYHYQREKGI